VWTDDRDGNYNQEIYTALVDLPVKVEENKIRNDAFVLYQNYPNPFSSQTTLHFDLHDHMHIKAEIYNASGQLVAQILDKKMNEGKHQINWSPADKSSGIYYLKVSSGKAVSYLKMTRY
jgi:flagellar hook assembly protein FlgD